MDFPINPFEDVKPADFNKLNKKNVTEDFVEENFKFLNWEVYHPFHDTGIDRIIVKIVCPDGHTEPNQNLNSNNYFCPVCNKKGIEIMRFVQVKTRQLKNNIFGFTLKSKDIRVDPRHIFLLYSDRTTNDKQDFLILSNKDLFNFFICNNISPFSSTSFRKGNNKLNSLKYNPLNDNWSWGRNSWEIFRNLEGMKLIQNPQIDLNLKNEILLTKSLADKLLKRISAIDSNSRLTSLVNTHLETNIKKNKIKGTVVNLRKEVKASLRNNCDNQTFSSMEKYFEGIILNLIQEPTYED